MFDPYRAVRRYRPGVWLLALLPLMSWGVDGQTGSPAGSRKLSQQPLSLSEALSDALQYNTAVRIARSRVEEKRGHKRHASRWVPDNPRLEVETARREAPGDTTRDLRIRISQEFWIGDQRSLNKASAQADLEAARARLDFLETATAARTRRAFLSLLWARRAVDSAQRLVAVNRQFAGYARKRLEAGGTTAMAVNSAEIGLTRAKAELADARNARERARLKLAELLSRDPAAPLEVSGELAPWSLSLPDQQTLLNKAVQRRQDLVAAGKAVAAARRELQLSRRQLIPNLTLFGFYKEEENAEVTGGGLSLPLPLLHQYGGERRAAAARLQQAQLQQEQLRLAVRRQILGAVADYRAAARRVKLLGQKTLERAEQNVSLTQRALRAGKVGAPALTSAQDNLIDVRRSYLQALKELVRAVTDLERASGGLIQVSAAPVN